MSDDGSTDERSALGWVMSGTVGALVVGGLASRVHPETLRKGFGWFVLVMGAFILVQEAPADWRLPAVGVLAAVAAAVAGWLLVRRRRAVPAGT